MVDEKVEQQPEGNEEVKEEQPEKKEGALSPREEIYSQIQEDAKKTNPNEDILAELEKPIEDDEVEEETKEETKEEPEEEPAKEPEKEETKGKDPIESMKAKMKGKEEEIKEAPEPAKKSDEPSIDQIYSYIDKMDETIWSDDASHEEKVEARAEKRRAERYLIKREREDAIRSIQEENTRRYEESKQQQKELNDLISDYSTKDIDSPYNLSNTNSKLYQTALALYQDKELNEKYYSDKNKISGFRRAVSDAFRELKTLEDKGELKVSKAKKEPTNKTERNDRIRSELGSPGAESAEEVSDVSTKAPLTDTEKVKQEIRERNKFKTERMKVPM